MSWRWVHSLLSHSQVCTAPVLDGGVPTSTVCSAVSAIFGEPQDRGPTSWRFTHPVSAPHSHVSPSGCQLLPTTTPPPESTRHSRSRSKTIAAYARPGRPVSSICVHSVPSHSHVSLEYPGVGSRTSPPKSTVRWRTVSYAIQEPRRPSGPMSATWVHSAPFHSHVSTRRCQLAPTTPPPPKRTSRWRESSYAILAQ